MTRTKRYSPSCLEEVFSETQGIEEGRDLLNRSRPEDVRCAPIWGLRGAGLRGLSRALPSGSEWLLATVWQLQVTVCRYVSKFDDTIHGLPLWAWRQRHPYVDLRIRP